MSLDSIAKHQGKSDITDGFLEIIRQLGFWLEAITGVNPDAGYSSFSAANYNHGNRSEQADLVEEVIIRLQAINDAGPGGGGSSADNKIRVDSSDTVSKTFDQLIDSTLNEVGWGKTDGSLILGKQVILIAKLAYQAGQKAYVGGDPDAGITTGRLNVKGEGSSPVAVFATTGGHTLNVAKRGGLEFKASEDDPEAELEIRSSGGIIRLISQALAGEANEIILHPTGGFQVSNVLHTAHATYNDVFLDASIAGNAIVALSNGTLVHKPNTE